MQLRRDELPGAPSFFFKTQLTFILDKYNYSKVKNLPRAKRAMPEISEIMKTKMIHYQAFELM